MRWLRPLPAPYVRVLDDALFAAISDAFPRMLEAVARLREQGVAFLAGTDTVNPWVVPGLHRRGTLLHGLTDLGWQCLEEPEDPVAVPLRAGSIAVFSSLTPHRTGPNESDAVRKAYIVQFAPDGARCLVASASGPDESAKSFGDAARRG